MTTVSAADRPPLALLEVLDRAVAEIAAALGLQGRLRFEIVADVDPTLTNHRGRVLALWPHAEPGKLDREALDLLVIPQSG